ncbi:MAG: hypothetical protein AAGI72_09750 [Pseudomonadota bacterium]
MKYRSRILFTYLFGTLSSNAVCDSAAESVLIFPNLNDDVFECNDLSGELAGESFDTDALTKKCERIDSCTEQAEAYFTRFAFNGEIRNDGNLSFEIEKGKICITSLKGKEIERKRTQTDLDTVECDPYGGVGARACKIQ